MAFRKHAGLALALASAILCFGCADDINAPNTTDEQPVLPPTNVTASALNNGHVQVKWDASSQPNTTGYNLYRREVGHGSSKRLNNTRIVTTTYMDQNTMAQKQYEYRVTTVNSKGTESHFTAVVIVTHDVIDDGSGRIPAPSTD